MPINYRDYPLNWKTEIRPAILERDGNCCKFCKVPNKIWVCRGKWNDIEVWQNDDGGIYNAKDGSYIGDSYVGDVWSGKEQRLTKIVLTIAHLDQDKTNNDYENLAALCQKCHLGIDLKHHMANARKTRTKKKGLQELFLKNKTMAQDPKSFSSDHILNTYVELNSIDWSKEEQETIPRLPEDDLEGEEGYENSYTTENREGNFSTTNTQD